MARDARAGPSGAWDQSGGESTGAFREGFCRVNSYLWNENVERLAEASGARPLGGMLVCGRRCLAPLALNERGLYTAPRPGLLHAGVPVVLESSPHASAHSFVAFGAERISARGSCPELWMTAPLESLPQVEARTSPRLHRNTSRLPGVPAASDSCVRSLFPREEHPSHHMVPLNAVLLPGAAPQRVLVRNGAKLLSSRSPETALFKARAARYVDAGCTSVGLKTQILKPGVRSRATAIRGLPPASTPSDPALSPSFSFRSLCVAFAHASPARRWSRRYATPRRHCAHVLNRLVALLLSPPLAADPSADPSAGPRLPHELHLPRRLLHPILRVRLPSFSSLTPPHHAPPRSAAAYPPCPLLTPIATAAAETRSAETVPPLCPCSCVPHLPPAPATAAGRSLECIPGSSTRRVSATRCSSSGTRTATRGSPPTSRRVAPTPYPRTHPYPHPTLPSQHSLSFPPPTRPPTHLPTHPQSCLCELLKDGAVSYHVDAREFGNETSYIDDCRVARTHAHPTCTQMHPVNPPGPTRPTHRTPCLPTLPNLPTRPPTRCRTRCPQAAPPSASPATRSSAPTSPSSAPSSSPTTAKARPQP